MDSRMLLFMFACSSKLHCHATSVDAAASVPEWSAGEDAEDTSDPGIQLMQKRMKLGVQQIPLLVGQAPLVAQAPLVVQPQPQVAVATSNLTGGVCTTYHEEAPENVLGFKATPFDIVADQTYLGGTRNYYGNLTGAIYLVKNAYQNIQAISCNLYVPGQSCEGTPGFTREILAGGWFLRGRKLRIAAQIGTPAWVVSLDDQDAVGMGSAQAPNWTYGQQLDGNMIGESDVVNISVTDVTYTEHRLEIALPFGVELKLLAVVSKLYGTYFNVENLSVPIMPGENEGVCGKNVDGNITNDFQPEIDRDANGLVDSTIHQPGAVDDLRDQTVTIPGFPSLARLQQVLDLCANSSQSKNDTWCDPTGNPIVDAFQNTPLLAEAVKMCASGACLSNCTAGAGPGQVRIGRDRPGSYWSYQRRSRRGQMRRVPPLTRRGGRIRTFKLGRITRRTRAERDAQCAFLCLQDPNCTAWSYGGAYGRTCVGFDGEVAGRLPETFRGGWRHAGKRSGTFTSCALGVPLPPQPNIFRIMANQMFDLADRNADERITRRELLLALQGQIIALPNSSVVCANSA